MPVQPTNLTSALAGAWCAIGLIPYSAWEEHNKLASVTSHNVAFAAFAVAFLVIPAYFLVFGHGTKAFDLTWFTKQEERSRYYVMFKRMMSWFLAAGAVMLLSSILLN